jgi:Ca2+-binding RTX toxin-like protein
MRRTTLLLTAMMLTTMLASGVALAVDKVGTDGSNTLRGTNGSDNLVGKGGNDNLFSLGGRDNLVGGPGRDNVLGGDERRTSGGDKNLVGGPGNDRVAGGRGSDNIVGEEGNDILIDGTLEEFSRDNLSGGAGKDVIPAINSPAFGDLVTCGGGFDRVLADRKDEVAPDCERVFIGLAAEEEFRESIPLSFFEGLPPFPEG